MQFDQTIEQHFPTHVLVRQHRGIEALTASLVAVIEGAREHEDNAALSTENTTQGGFQTGGDQDFLERNEPPLRALKSQIIWPAVETYLEQVLDCNPLLTPVSLVSWAVSLGPGDWQAPHFHPKEYTLISGVYYVSVPEATEPEGCLEFVNPNLNAVSMGNQPSSRLHRPETGQIILFPPYYMHFVHPLKARENRHVIAFDVRLQQT
jgi:uncharacterized protein (TIGR02466 family)